MKKLKTEEILDWLKTFPDRKEGKLYKSYVESWNIILQVGVERNLPVELAPGIFGMYVSDDWDVAELQNHEIYPSHYFDTHSGVSNVSVILKNDTPKRKAWAVILHELGHFISDDIIGEIPGDRITSEMEAWKFVEKIWDDLTDKDFPYDFMKECVRGHVKFFGHEYGIDPEKFEN